MTLRDSTYDAIVIGAGPSGLAAGIRVASSGASVVMLERHYAWGGQNSFYKKAGRLFDVGLHALTNFAPQGARGTPLPRLLRQLRLRHADLRLGEQSFSEIVFPGLRLRFSNDFQELRTGFAEAFPRSADGFERLVRRIEETPLAIDESGPGAREVMAGFLADELAIDALLLPLTYYGSAREHDCEWGIFTILFKSIFIEGLARPEGGILPFLKILVQRFRDLGGELRMRAGVQRILVERGRATGVELESGEVLHGRTVLSSAGSRETLELYEPQPTAETSVALDDGGGRLSFVETLSALDVPPAELGYGGTITFFCTTDRLHYRRPQAPVDLTSGVIATPNNYATSEPLEEGLMRTTSLADPGFWCDEGLEEERYVAAKRRSVDDILEAVCGIVPDFRSHIVYQDAFTPRTIQHYTGHLEGAVYGSPRKVEDGCTPVDGLYVMGTDHGFPGVVGSMTSGCTIANRYVLAPRLAGSVA